MSKPKIICGGFLSGVLGGMAVDLIYIELAGPSALFTLIGITNRLAVFWSHALLGGILGLIFLVILGRLPHLNIWLAGISYGLACLTLIGGVPSTIARFPMTLTTITFGFLVWIIFGLILAATTQNFRKQYGR